MVDAADAFVIVMPQYNYGFNAALKNALDYLFDEWRDKPVGLVSIGSVSGGLRGAAAQAGRQRARNADSTKRGGGTVRAEVPRRAGRGGPPRGDDQVRCRPRQPRAPHAPTERR